MRRELGANTWIWTSPLDDAALPTLAARVARMGFTVLEMPVENLGDWDPSRAADVLREQGLQGRVVGAMAPGRDLVDPDPAVRESTRDYLRACVDAAVAVGSPTVAGPFYAATGRTWRMSPGERAQTVQLLRDGLAPVVEHAADAGVTLAVEPLNRYETSLLNTVEQALEALAPLLGPGLGLALDSFHLNIEERDVGAAVRSAGRHCAVVQVCGNDRGAVGDDHVDWAGFLDALDDIGYTGPLTLESFTGHNDTIATAASIWRPLAASQDDLARRSLEHLTALQDQRAGAAGGARH